MDKIDLCGKRIDGEFVFRGDSDFVPRIGEKILINNIRYIVEDVEYCIFNLFKPKVFVILKELTD